jgi:phosphoribosylformylglycinamidine synthase
LLRTQGVLIQVKNVEKVRAILDNYNISYISLADVTLDQKVTLNGLDIELNVPTYRDIWFKSSYLLDQKQSGKDLARQRFDNYKKQPLSYQFGSNWSGKLENFKLDPFRKEASGHKAAIIREKGVNGDREMAYALWLAGFDVKDVHMTDLISGRENLEDVNMIVFVGGFSNSDVLGSAKGWAGAFLYNEKAKQALG